MATGGLEGVVAATTRLSEVDGERGELVIAGFPVGELADRASFEEVTWLLWHGDLPDAGQLAGFRRDLAAARALPDATLALLRECAARTLDTMDALRMAAGTLTMVGDDPVAIAARIPTIVAAYGRLRRGETPVAPRPDLGHTASYLYMLSGEAPDDERVRGLETYLNTVIDHGLNIAGATAAPRIHHQWLPDELRIEEGISPDTIALLEAKGHHVALKAVMGSTQSIMITGDGLFGSSDPRRAGALTLGY